MFTGSDKIVNFALLSRVAILCIQVVANAIIPDHNADAFNPPKPADVADSAADKIVNFLFGGLRRWDGIYFLHIAEHGYIYENSLAFFPLFPLLVRSMANTLGWPLSFIMSYANVLLLMAVLLNNWLFVKSAVLLFRLGCDVLRDEKLAYKGALLFCLNPASVFMSAPYTETLFCFFSLKGWLSLAKRGGFSAAFYWGLSGAVRSNGVVSLGFLWYKNIVGFMKRLYELCFGEVHSKENFLVLFGTYCWLYGGSVLLYSVLCLTPFGLFQYFAYSTFCFYKDNSAMPDFMYRYGQEQNYKMWGPPYSSWCRDALPLSYQYIQKSHWGVGLFQYYQWKQIPNFILAAPMGILAFSACFHYFIKNQGFCTKLGIEIRESIADNKGKSRADHPVDFGLQNRKLFLYMVHLTFLLTFGLLFVHIQVLTRMLASSCPLLYWYAAYLTDGESRPTSLCNPYSLRADRGSYPLVDTRENLLQPYRNALTDQLTGRKPFQSSAGQAVVMYFVVYFVIGTIAFSNFLPWT